MPRCRWRCHSPGRTLRACHHPSLPHLEDQSSMERMCCWPDSQNLYRSPDPFCNPPRQWSDHRASMNCLSSGPLRLQQGTQASASVRAHSIEIAFVSPWLLHERWMLRTRSIEDCQTSDKFASMGLGWLAHLRSALQCRILDSFLGVRLVWSTPSFIWNWNGETHGDYPRR
ncbi:hypothetical protein SDC9_192775 [bioreactor metagenome]|uniref:Uncharacterized protein n=1 Tax=bioreactor metagenome TaxID=1076179 RepID=A0A645I1U1_9ZZZZ